MIERRLNWQQLGITTSRLIQETDIDDALYDEADALIRDISAWLEARFAFVTTGTEALTRFNPGSIITARLNHSEALCFFVATAGERFEQYQQQLMRNGDMVRVYIANEIGSMIAESAADCMEEALQEQLTPKGLHRTNRYSPGYCGWDVCEQTLLFSLFPHGQKDAPSALPTPCGIELSESCLMHPIKSVSGVIGIGHEVKRMQYTCDLCRMPTCYKRKNKNKDK